MSKSSIFIMFFKIKTVLPSWRIQLAGIITFNFLGSLKMENHMQKKKRERKIRKIGLSSLTPGVINYLNKMFSGCSAFSPLELSHLTGSKQQDFYSL